MKKIIVIVFLLITFSNIAIADEMDNKIFTDLENTKYQNEICFLARTGIIKGYSDGTFKPEKVVTKMEYIKMMLDGLGYKEDIPLNEYWGSNYIKLAERIGFIEKNQYKQDDLNDYTNKEDIFRLTEKALIFIGDDITKEELYNYHFINNNLDINPYENIESIEDVERLNINDISPLYLKGIVNDIFLDLQYDDVINKYLHNITRAEASAIISRVINKDYRIKMFEGEIKDE